MLIKKFGLPADPEQGINREIRLQTARFPDEISQSPTMRRSVSGF
jgi:hypothetical protein